MKKKLSLRKLRWIIATALLPALIGCSALRLSYNQGPLLAYWWLDGYADFSSEQSPRVKAALRDWFAWHRATQLADYADWLAAAERQAVDKLTPAQVCSAAEQLQQRAERAYAQAVPPLAELLRALTPAQIEHLEHRYAKGDAEYADEMLQADLAERRRKALERVRDRAESFYGPLDAAQRQLLARLLDDVAAQPQRTLDERRARQRDIVAGLRRLQAQQADAASWQAAVRAWGLQALRSPRPEHRAYQQRTLQASCTLIAELHNAMRPAQRQRAVDKLKGWEDDLRALLREAAEPAPAAGDGRG